jgi:hypothetical protein
MDFNDVSDKAPVQEFDIPQDRNVAEYTVKYIFSVSFAKVVLTSDPPGRQNSTMFPP